MTSRPSRSRKPASKQAAAKRSARKPAAGLVSGEVYEDYLRGVAEAQTLPPTLPGVSCPPFTLPAAQCQPAGGVQSAAGFPTIPLQHCVKTIPGLNCPVETLPIVKCLPDEPAGGTIPIVGCPKTIPGVTCDLPTVPVLGCVPEHAEAEVAAPLTLIPTVLPPCPTIPGVSCPVPTVPITSCAQDRTRTLPVVGCPPTLPGITCPLPTVPVLRCLPQLTTPAPDVHVQAARAAIDQAPAALQRYKKIVAGGAEAVALPHTLPITCRSMLIIHCPTAVPYLCPSQFPPLCPTQSSWYPTCGPTIPLQCCLPPTLPPRCNTILPFCEWKPELPGEPVVRAATDLGGFQPFPTIPVDRCLRTIPGVNCPVPTIPIRDCLPIDTLPVVGCPRTIPGVVCDIETIPLSRCIGDKVPDPPEIKTIIPPCPTIPGVTCPIRTIPITSCLPGPEALADAKEAEVKAAATLPVIGCPPTIPGVTCDLPTVPVVTCLDGPDDYRPPVTLPPPLTLPPGCPPPYTVYPGCPPPYTLPGCLPPTLRCGYAGEALAPTQPPGCAAVAAPTQPPGCAAVHGGGLVPSISSRDCLPGGYADPSTYTMTYRCPTLADPGCGLETLTNPLCFPPTLRDCPSSPFVYCPPVGLAARLPQAQALAVPQSLLRFCPSLHSPCPTPPVTINVQGCVTLVPWQCRTREIRECWPSLATPCPTPPVTIPIESCDPVPFRAAAGTVGGIQAGPIGGRSIIQCLTQVEPFCPTVRDPSCLIATLVGPDCLPRTLQGPRCPTVLGPPCPTQVFPCFPRTLACEVAQGF